MINMSIEGENVKIKLKRAGTALVLNRKKLTRSATGQ